MKRESAVSCQLRMSIATRVLAMTTTLETIDEAVSVTTDWIPPTSLVKRDWISPVRVEVKKRIDSPWRWV